MATYLIAARQAEAFLRARGKELPQASRADFEAFISLLRKRLRLLVVGAGCESDAVAVARECEPVRIDEQALTGAIELIAHDLTATLGWDGARARAEARDALDARMDVLPGDPTWEQLDPASRQEVLEHLVAEAVERLQQLLHDTFVDTTWPACPRHRQHPLWLGEGEGGGIAWCCPRDRAAVAPLGALPARPPDARS